MSIATAPATATATATATAMAKTIKQILFYALIFAFLCIFSYFQSALSGTERYLFYFILTVIVASFLYLQSEIDDVRPKNLDKGKLLNEQPKYKPSNLPRDESESAFGKLRGISHFYDENNEWIEYEYVMHIDNNHIRISRYNDSGKLINIQHQFNNIDSGSSGSDFINIMENFKAIGHQNNVDYLKSDSEPKIDLTSSIENAKIMRKYKS